MIQFSLQLVFFEKLAPPIINVRNFLQINRNMILLLLSFDPIQHNSFSNITSLKKGYKHDMKPFAARI